MRKFAKTLSRRIIVGASRRFCGIETSEILKDAIFFHPSLPATTFCSNNTLKTTPILLELSLVAHIFSVGASPKILLSVIQSIVVYVVSLFCSRTEKNFPVHCKTVDFTFAPFAAPRVKTICPWAPYSLPSPLRKTAKILNVNDSCLVARKRNKAVRFVERLDNFMSFDAITSTLAGHFPTPNRNLLFSRILAQGVCV